MREHKRKDRKRSQPPFEIDLVVPGLGAVTGRGDRFRCSAETRSAAVLNDRRRMIRDLALRLLFDVLAARLDGRITTEELEVGYRQGPMTLRELVNRAKLQRLDGLLDRWMDVCRIRTKAASRRHVQSFITFCGGAGHATTASLTAERIEQWLSSLTDQRRANAGSKRTSSSAEAIGARTRRATASAKVPRRAVTTATRNRHLASLSGFCTFLVDNLEVVAKHPIRGKVRAGAEAKGRMPNVGHQQWLDYLAALSADPRSPVAAVLVANLLRHTGADVGEVLGLTRRSGEYVRGLSPEDLLHDGAMPRITFKRQKVDLSPSRDVPCHRELFDSLVAHIRAFEIGNGDEVFRVTNRSAFEAAHCRATRTVGMKGLRLKDLRHVAAISWVKAGVPLTRVSKWLGHSSITQTAIYADFAPDAEYDMPLVERAVRLAAGSGISRDNGTNAQQKGGPASVAGPPSQLYPGITPHQRAPEQHERM